MYQQGEINISEKGVTDSNESVKYYFQLLNTLRLNNEQRQIAQDKQALKMKRDRGECVSVKIGDIVNVRIPIVDKAPCKTLDIIGVVFRMNLHTKTIAVVTEHGVLAYGGKGEANKKVLNLDPVRDYEVISQYLPISLKLKTHTAENFRIFGVFKRV